MKVPGARVPGLSVTSDVNVHFVAVIMNDLY